LRKSKKDFMTTAAKKSAMGIGGVFSIIFRIIGTLLLIGVTTGLIFACIFAIYLKTNLTDELDMTLEDFTLNLTSVVYYEDSDTGEYKELTALQSSENRTWVSYDNIPLDMEHAVVAIEDKRFYKHNGVDWFRTTHAFFNMFLSMDDTFGGSTLTQQLIKNLTTEDEVTVQRKLLEIFRALELEKNYKKNQIIEWYLNVVYFGHGQYGIGAASNYYFGKDVSELSLAEMCSIVGITNNPSMYSPYINKERNKERQEDILFQMYDQGYIDKETYDDAVAEKLVFQRGEDEEEETVIYSYFVDAVIEDAISDLMEAKGCTYKVAQRLLFTAGYKIYSTIDVGIQEKVDTIYQDLDQIPKTTGSTQQFQSGIVITDPKTGNIVALSGGVGEKTANRVLNRATYTQRPAGSSFKPIAVYAPAMDLGLITPNTRFEDSEDVTLKGTDWMPKNDDRKYSGVVTVREGLRRSINTVSAQILDELSPQTSFDFLTQKLGMEDSLVYYRDGLSDLNYAPLALGQLTDGVTVREMAAAYDIFTNGGVYTETRTYTKICDADDNVVLDNEPETNVAISETTAYWMTSMLKDAATSGTGYEAKLSNMPTAGKTGTTSDNCDRWFCGFTPYYTAVVWTGYDTPAKIHVTGNPAAQLWKKVMSSVHEDLEYKDFSTPTNTYQAPVPGVDEPTDYTVRGVDENGAELYTDTGSKLAGREVTVVAKNIDGYTLMSEQEVTITVKDDPAKNIITFTYQNDTPAVPETPEDPGTGEPGGTDTPTDPGTAQNDTSTGNATNYGIFRSRVN